MNVNTEFSIPSGYGDNKIVLMVRDPWTLFAYWEVNKTVEVEAIDAIHRKGMVVSKTLLRLCDVTESDFGEEEKSIRDFEIKTWTEDWYVHDIASGRKWMAAVGVLCTTGEFFEFVRSNIVETPLCVKNRFDCGSSSFGSAGYMSSIIK